MSVKFYDPAKITISVCNRPITGGFATDEKVKVAFDGPHFDDDAGVDGEVVRSKTHDRRGTVTISLMQTSDANDILSGLLAADYLVPGGAGVGAFMLKDLEGRTIIKAAAAWVKGLPESAFAKKAGVRAWEIRLANVEATLGGNLGTG